jgi:Tfp pilus assembly protein PilN
VTQALPGGVSLTDLSYNNASKKISISGTADNTVLVGRMLKNFEDSPGFRRSVLIEARKTSVESVNKVLFRITFSLI